MGCNASGALTASADKMHCLLLLEAFPDATPGAAIVERYTSKLEASAGGGTLRLFASPQDTYCDLRACLL